MKFSCAALCAHHHIVIRSAARGFTAAGLPATALTTLLRTFPGAPLYAPPTVCMNSSVVRRGAGRGLTATRLTETTVNSPRWSSVCPPTGRELRCHNRFHNSVLNRDTTTANISRCSSVRPPPYREWMQCELRCRSYRKRFDRNIQNRATTSIDTCLKFHVCVSMSVCVRH